MVNEVPPLDTEALLTPKPVTTPTQQTWGEWYDDLDVLSDFPNWYYKLTWIWKFVFFIPFLFFWIAVFIVFILSIPVGFILLIVSIPYWMITGKSLLGKS